MASTFVVSRSHLIYGVCLPLAVLIGYFLAEPLESGSVAVVVLVLSVLSIPVFMRWHHVLLICSWNAICMLYFLPGNPSLWLVLAFISFFFSVLGRSVGEKRGFFEAPNVARSLIVFAVIVVITAQVTGGVGFKSLGASTYGGKKYFFLLGGIICYFALAGQRINPNKAGLYLGLFFLSGMAVFLGYLSAVGGPSFDFLGNMFPSELELQGDRALGNDFLAPQTGLFRLGSIIPAANGAFFFLLARYGIRGVFDLQRPWRLLAFGLTLAGALACGFRAVLITFLLIFFCLFLLEGLFKPRYLFLLLVGCMLAAALVLPVLQRMPLGMQRTLSFLPLNVDPMVRNSSDSSTEWRLQMWKEVLPMVPRYLFRGKGYALDPAELNMAIMASYNGSGVAAEGSILAGDYHNGGLSLLIPFGVYGVAAFLWFLYASLRVLHQNFRYGDPALQAINNFLLAYFIVRIVMFFFVFGSLHSDMVGFTGLVGFSVSLNGVARPPEELPEPAEPVEEDEE